MAIKKFLKDGNGKQVWPITRADCIYTVAGDQLLNEAIEDQHAALQKAIDDEIARAKAAEKANADEIANMKNADLEGSLANKIAANDAAIKQEAQDRADAVKGVQDQLDALAGDGEGSVADQIADLKTDLEGQMATEKAARDKKDGEQDQALIDAIGVAPAEGVEGSGLRKEIADAVKAEKERAEGVESGHNERLEALETFKNTTQPAKDSEQDNRIQALEDANAEGGAVANAIKQVADDLADFEEAQATKDGQQDQAIQAAQNAADKAQQEVDALEVVVGNYAGTDAEGGTVEASGLMKDVAANAAAIAKEAGDRAAADTQIRTDFAAADAQLKTDLQAEIDADVLVEKNRAEGVEAAIRQELANAIAKEVEDRDAAIKVEADRAKAEEADIRADFAAADAALKAELQAEIDADVKVEKERAEGVEQGLAGRLDIIEGEGEGSIKKAVKDLADRHDEEMTDAEERLDALEAKFAGDESVDNKIEAAKQAALDALDAHKTAQATKDGEQDQALINEADRAKGEEQRIEGLVTAEAERADAEEKRIVGLVEAEATRAAAAEKANADEMTKQKDAAQEGTLANKIAANAAAVAAEQERAEGAEQAINAEIANMKDATKDGSLAKKIADEVTARENADNALDERLQAVEGSIGDGGALEARVAANEEDIATIMGEGEGSIKKAVADLVDGAPEALDTLNELAAALRDKADVLDAVEEAFDNKLATLQADVDQNEADCDAAIAAEKGRAEGQEAAIRQELANEKAALQAEIDADVKVVADELAKQKDAAQEGTLAKQIADEVTRAQGQEAAIRGEFANADSALETALKAWVTANFISFDDYPEDGSDLTDLSPDNLI